MVAAVQQVAALPDAEYKLLKACEGHALFLHPAISVLFEPAECRISPASWLSARGSLLRDFGRQATWRWETMKTILALEDDPSNTQAFSALDLVKGLPPFGSNVREGGSRGWKPFLVALLIYFSPTLPFLSLLGPWWRWS